MALTSVFYDGYVTETDRAKNRGGVPDYGVYGPDDFKVTAHPSIPYAVLVKAGRAHGHGVTDTAQIDQVVQCATIAAPASNIRWDLIVVRRNWQPALGGPSTLEAIQAGTTAAIPAGRKVGPGVEDDQPIFLVKWQGGTSAPVEFIDLRVHAANGGLFAQSDLVRTYLTGVGTTVNINGALWSLQLDGQAQPGWVRVLEAPGGTVPTGGGTLARSDGTANINFGDTTLRVNIDTNTGAAWSNRRGSGLECPVPGVYFISGRILTEGPAGRYGTGYIIPDKADMVGSLTWTEDTPGAAYGGISFSGTFVCPTGPAFWFTTTAYNTACTIRPPSRVTCTRVSKIG
jgi:hypothetical protein